MMAKLQTILFTTLILLSLLPHQYEATALKGAGIATRKGHTTIIKSPIGLMRIRENGVTVDASRYLKGEEKHVHKRPTKPFFPVLLAVLIVNIISLVVLLSVIPVLENTMWSCLKSMFWVANSRLNHTTEIARQSLNMDRSSTNNTDDKQTKESTVARVTNIFVPAYACGAILATAVFLVIPEAILFIQRGTSSEDRGEIEIFPGDIVRFGVSLMAGYIFPLVLGTLCPRSFEHICTKECVSSSELTVMDDQKTHVHQKTVEEEFKDDEEIVMNESLLTTGTFECDSHTNGGETKLSRLFDSKTSNSISDSIDTEGDINVESPTKINLAGEYKRQKNYNVNYLLIKSILFGGATYNFFDGIFIGAAFLTCSNTTAVCVAIIAIYSEISQQVADYFLLTQCAGVSIPRSLLLIFIASLAEIFGAMMIISSGLGELAIGVILAFASGVYLHISASECLPRVYSVVKVSRDMWFALTFFMFGAIPIGLTLLYHGHCN